MEPLTSPSTTGVEVFWGEIAPPEHLVHIYEHENAFLDSLEGFVAGGLRAGEAVISIATIPHLRELESRLTAHGVNMAALRADDQYLTLDANHALSQFMVNGWPDEELFNDFVVQLIQRARKGGRRVRAFGEMVAILWAQGRNGATVRLEHLWNNLCRSEEFSLFCAYPKSGFTEDSDVSLREICAAHSKVIGL